MSRRDWLDDSVEGLVQDLKDEGLIMDPEPAATEEDEERAKPTKRGSCPRCVGVPVCGVLWKEGVFVAECELAKAHSGNHRDPLGYETPKGFESLQISGEGDEERSAEEEDATFRLMVTTEPMHEDPIVDQVWREIAGFFASVIFDGVREGGIALSERLVSILRSHPEESRDAKDRLSRNLAEGNVAYECIRKDGSGFLTRSPELNHPWVEARPLMYAADSPSVEIKELAPGVPWVCLYCGKIGPMGGECPDSEDGIHAVSLKDFRSSSVEEWSETPEEK